ncbi:hypothetical protein [Streptomyces sp. NPDC001100]
MYSKKQLGAAIDKIMQASAVRHAADLTVYSAAPASDSSGILVTARKSATAAEGADGGPYSRTC